MPSPKSHCQLFIVPLEVEDVEVKFVGVPKQDVPTVKLASGKECTLIF